MTKDEALRLALEALSEAHYVVEHRQDVKKREQAITAIKAALEAKDEETELEKDVVNLLFALHDAWPSLHD
jgi:mannitol/fructose-specific phosphotransferase system IIA component (Ntr-type)